MITIKYSQNIQTYIPSPVKQFLFDYDHSKFIECNHDLSIINAKDIEKNKNKLIKVFNSLSYLTKSLESMHKHYALIEGTLLGKS